MARRTPGYARAEVFLTGKIMMGFLGVRKKSQRPQAREPDGIPTEHSSPL